MIKQCQSCDWTYDDEFRSTICPHDLFPANDGHNNFTIHYESIRYCPHDIEEGIDCMICDTTGVRS